MRYTTRRSFLQRAAAAGGCLALRGLAGTTCAGQPAAVGTADRSPAIAPILVVAQPVSKDINPRAGSWSYLTEVLQRAGLFFEQLPPAELPSLFGRPNAIVLLAGHLPLGQTQREALTAWVRKGGSLIGIGGTSGLDEVFGTTGETPLADGWIKVTKQHPVTAGLRSSLHIFGGYVVKTGSGTSLAILESGSTGPKGNVIVENRFGQGRAVLLSPDLMFSILHIQQGLPVLQDGRPAPDDSAPINDGILKAEDGSVLDWQRDRQPMPPEDVPAFLEPVSDELRQIILRSIFYLAQQQGATLPMLWYWPRGLKAVGQISHDTDGNDPAKAVAMLEATNRCQVKSTWCTLYPGGYSRDFYRTLQQQGYEIALHYDGKTGGVQTSWSKENFLLQHRWLLEEAGLKHITTNKNHYLRWEGQLDLWRWCEEVGIESDQSRGPSKKGTIGFPLGGSQPYFPLDDQVDSPRLLRVLEVNLLTQDLVVTCPAEYGRPLVDSALRHHGVAHFLFHPNHILKPGVEDALRGVVDHGRTQGLEWWTNQQIVEWELLRRGVQATFDAPNALALRAGRSLDGATLLFLKAAQGQPSISLNGQSTRSNPWNLYGFEFDAVTTDIVGTTRVRIA
jgi:hypothetical protein